MNKFNQKWVMWFRPDRKWTRNAITIGQTTYYSVSEAQVDAAWKKHEDIHKVQWKHLGPVMFPLKYFWYQWKYGYDKNPLDSRGAPVNAPNTGQASWWERGTA